jgi:hypothetical protein
METKDMLINYLTKFRLECHFRLSFYPEEMNHMPIDVYNSASNEAKNEIIKELNLNDKQAKLIDKVHKYFIDRVVEIQDYNEAEKKTKEAIEEGLL